MKFAINNIYIIDSSALIDLHKFYGQNLLPDLWKELDSMFKNNRIISHVTVYDELTTNAKRPSELSKWVSKKRPFFKDMTVYQATKVANIINKFPNLIDPYSEKDQADPWIIALVFEEQENPTFFTINKNIVVVSQENPASKNKIPAVCKYYDILHFDLKQFFKANEWELIFNKR